MRRAKYILLFSVVCILLSHLPTHSQSANLEKLSHFTVLSFDNFIQGDKKSNSISNSLDLGDYGQFELDVQETYLIADDYIVQTSTSEGIVKTKSKSGIRTYIGQLKNDPGSTVALTVNEDYIHGFIRSGKTEINIEPLRYYSKKALRHEIMVYKTSDQEHKHKIHCGIDAKIEEQFQQSVESQKELKSQAGGCIEVDMAVASDYLMFAYYGSIAEVENHAIAILNAAQTNYDTEFADEIKFNLVEQFISTCPTCDPWVDSTDSETLLKNYREWADNSWENAVDQSSLWSKRDFQRGGNTSANGLAWLNTVCTTHSSLIVEDNDTGERKRVLFSHELGHNFGAVHDDDNTSFIMSSPLAETNEWSSTSLETINKRYLRFPCLTSCEKSENVVAGFDVEFIGACVPVTVQYRNNSFGELDSVMWIFPGGNPTFSTELEPIVTYGIGGTFDVRLEVFGSNGTSDIVERRDYISFGQLPPSTYSYKIEDSRVGFSIDIPFDNTEYVWDFGDGFTSTELNPTHTFSDIENARVKLTATNNCGSSFTEYVLMDRILIPPTANFTSSERFLCVNESVQFINLSEESDSLSWFLPGSNVFNTSIENPVVSYSQSGVFDVGLIAINSAGADSVAVPGYSIVDPEPVSNFQYSIEDKTISLIQTSQFARALQWDFGDGTISEELNPTHAYKEAGVYEVLLTVENFCTSSLYAQTIVIEETAVNADFIASSTQLCAGGSILFTNQSENASSFLWEFEGGVPASSTDANPLIVYPEAGTYTVTLTAKNGLIETELVKENLVVISGKPQSSFEFAQLDSQVSFKNNSTNVETTLWNFGDGRFSTELNPKHEYAENGDYTVILTSTNACGSESFSQTISINEMEMEAELPSAMFEENTKSICAGSVISFTNTSENADSYQWTFEGGIPATSTEASPSVLYISAGTFNVSLIAKTETAKDTVSFEDYLKVSNQPRALFESRANENTVIFSNLSAHGETYLWNFGDGSLSSETSPEHVYELAGEYQVVLAVINDCGNSEISRTVIVENVANTDAEQITDFNLSDDKICIGETLGYTSISTNVDEISWLLNDATEISGGKISFPEAGFYTISLIVTRGVESQRVDKIVEVIGRPNPSFSFERIEETNQILFTNTSTNATNYIWSFGDRFSSAFENPVHAYSINAVYEVQLIASNSCSSAQLTQTLDLGITEKPSALFAATQPNICTGQTVTFEALGLHVTEVDWEFENGTLISDTEKTATVLYDAPGRFDVRLIASNLNGKDTSIMTEMVIVSDAPDMSLTYKADKKSVIFNATAVANATYAWDFGDGNTSTEINPVHQYAGAGEYEVSVSVDLSCGRVVLFETITIEADVLLPKATMSITNNKVDLAGRILFKSTSINTDNVEWYFEGGDPERSTEDQLIVQYDNAGVFDVILIASNQFASDTVVFTDVITVAQLDLGSSVETRENTIDFTNVKAQVSPNPFDQSFAVEIQHDKRDQGSLFLYNSSGALVHDEQFIMDQPFKLVHVSQPDLSPGMYIVRIIIGDQTIQQKIIKL